MKKEKLNLYILIGCLALTVLFAILTIVYMIKSFHAIGVIALVVDIFALGVIASCFMQEKKEMEDDSTQEVVATEANVEITETEEVETETSEENNDQE